MASDRSPASESATDHARPHSYANARPPLNVLGISDTHNASAALMGDRVGLVALQEERPTREKIIRAFRTRASSSCSTSAGLRPAEVDVVALAGYINHPDRDRQGYSRSSSEQARTRRD